MSKLEFFNPVVPAGNKETVRVDAKGVIHFSHALVQEINLTNEHCMSPARLGKKWYLLFTADGFQLTKREKGSSALCFRSRSICRSILADFKVTGSAGYFDISDLVQVEGYDGYELTLVGVKG